MGRDDALKDKIIKLGNKQKISAVIKYSDHPNPDIRMTVAMTLGMIPCNSFIYLLHIKQKHVVQSDCKLYLELSNPSPRAISGF